MDVFERYQHPSYAPGQPLYADVLICSHPRSGGRWLRYLLAHYLADRPGLSVPEDTDEVFAIVPDHNDEARRGYPAYAFNRQVEMPLIAVCHQPYAWELHRGYPIAFLARNAYDVAVSGYHHLSDQKNQYSGSMRDFIRHPILGIGAWIRYMNGWAPRLLTHRDTQYISYARLVSDPEEALASLLHFLDEKPSPRRIASAARAAAQLRSQRKIKTGQEGNFWDHLQPEEIFDIQGLLNEGLSEMSVALLERIGVDVDPFPRSE